MLRFAELRLLLLKSIYSSSLLYACLFVVILGDLVVVVHHAHWEWEYPHLAVWGDGISLACQCAAIALFPSVQLVPTFLVDEDE